MATRPSAVIIGAGASGMVSALLLAMHGYRVSIVERAKEPGVTLRGFLKSRVYFDSGVHFVGELSPHGVLTAYLRYLGIRDLPSVEFDRHCFETVRFSDRGDFSLAADYDKMLAGLCADFPAEKEGIHRYMADVKAAYYSSAFHTLQGSPFRDETDPRWHIPLQNYIAGFIRDPWLQSLLAIPCLYHGVSPENVSFLQHARVAGTHFGGVRTFAQGGLSLVKAFEQRLAEEGVVLHCNRRAVQIHCKSDGTLSEVELDNGERLGCSVVIYTGHPGFLPQMLPEKALRPAAVNRMNQLYDGMSAHLLYLSGGTEPPPLLDKKNLLYCQHARSFTEAFKPHHRGTSGPFYIMPGPSVLNRESGLFDSVDFVATIPCDAAEYRAFYGTGSGKRPSAYRTQKKQRLNALYASLCRSVPEIEGLRLVDGATPATLQKYLYSPGAGMYGVAHDITQFNPLPVTRVAGLFVAGQAVTGPGVMGATISAFLACGYLLDHQNLLNGVRACR
ncbi:NAD(P)/FAD-dependent oxidoreductase [Erwinia sp. S38]|uniref:phytoene desaturase family protein n=1 Tax=Erwinia sp. S38 TaxID=2769338 RepID=UPI00190CECD5|nr:NAD(P)/FAD-dependent oxidoreductase [Erwinia sp. S38]MBK0001489.1 NAD(P)/FAD-dependent oxidoreductase [Erwinia sp. S38]